MRTPHDPDAVAWAARATRRSRPLVQAARLPTARSRPHQARARVARAAHSRAARLGRADSGGLVLHAALWHDIGREGDGIEPEHGRRSAERADELGLTAKLPSADAAVVRFAILRHSLPDSGAARWQRELAASKDGGAPTGGARSAHYASSGCSRTRTPWTASVSASASAPIPRQLRHQETIQLIPFASALYAVLMLRPAARAAPPHGNVHPRHPRRGRGTAASRRAPM